MTIINKATVKINTRGMDLPNKYIIIKRFGGLLTIILVYRKIHILYINSPNSRGDVYSPKAWIVKTVKHKKD